MICLQAAINVAVATVSVPTKGLSLPLVSAGGSGLVITCAALGLLYSVALHSWEPSVALGRLRVVSEAVWRAFCGDRPATRADPPAAT
jgi:cell division protein FtsW